MDDQFWHDFEKFSPKKQYQIIFDQPTIRRFILFILPLVLLLLMYLRVSVRGIRIFCRYVFHVELSKQRIQSTIRKKAVYLSRVNAELDQKVGDQISHVDLDGTWKGKFRKIFGGICKQSHYLILLQWVKAESIDALAPAFARLKHICFNLKAIYTDLARVFCKELPAFFRGIAVKACNVHADRILLRALSPLQKVYKKACRRLTEVRLQLKKAKAIRGRIRQKVYDKRTYLKKLKAKRLQMYRTAGLKVTLPGTLANRRKGVTPAIQLFTLRIGCHQTRLTQLEKSKVFHEAKVARLKNEVEQCKQAVKTGSQPVLQGKRLERAFWRILHTSNPIEQLQKLTLFMDRLENHSHPLAATIKNLFEKNLSLLGTSFLSSANRLSVNKENTNDIENFFGILRPYLELWRNVPDTPYIHDCLEIVRALHNLLGPISGFNERISPISYFNVKWDLDATWAHLCNTTDNTIPFPDVKKMKCNPISASS